MTIFPLIAESLCYQQLLSLQMIDIGEYDWIQVKGIESSTDFIHGQSNKFLFIRAVDFHYASRYCTQGKAKGQIYAETNPLEWISSTGPPVVQHPDNGSQVVSTETIALNLFAKTNISKEEIQSLNTWNLMKHLITHDQALPNAVEATKEGGIAWNSLMTSVEEERLNRNEVSEDTVIVQNTWTVAHD
ncbi:hypothetical protein POM88_023334 [Heracleum sosnowskyi]|uniref:Uncharacterized protein n=1 Tax=Heracleum sosnowskyi TaxID=360622 RepID=A0AAD8IGU9_9APIA|nr:hypothetical protein POM88_023334 [Heracleum sosnowskyi]